MSENNKDDNVTVNDSSQTDGVAAPSEDAAQEVEVVTQEQNVAPQEVAQQSIGTFLQKFREAWSDPKKKLIIIVVMVLQVIFILYVLSKVFGGDSKKHDFTPRNSRSSYDTTAQNIDVDGTSDSLPQFEKRTEDNESVNSFIDEKIDEDLSFRQEAKAPLPPMPPAPLEPIAPMAIPEVPYEQDGGDDINEPEPFTQTVNSEDDDRNSEEMRNRMSASSVVFGGGGGGLSGDDDNKAGGAKKKSSGFLGFDGGVIENEDELLPSGSDNVVATKVMNMDRTLVQGKMIDAVLETAINTTVDTPGTLRAIVSRDVYAEHGNNILIPKGSRVVGTYGVDMQGGARLNATWERIITPAGIDIEVASQSTDELGRVGVIGRGDDKIMNKLLSAFLISYMIPYAAYKITDADENNSTSSAVKDGNSNSKIMIPDGKDEDGNVKYKTIDLGKTDEGTPKERLIRDATDKFTEIGSNAVESRFPSKTIISVAQGTAVRIFVSKDLIFPQNAVYRNTRKRR